MRAAAAGAALVLTALSRGDLLVVVGLLAVAAWRPLVLAAVGPAAVAVGWRWGATSMEALAGAQAVLGPGGLVSPTTSAAACWLAALAVLLATGSRDAVRRVRPSPGPEAVLAAAGAVVAAAVVAGPAPGGALWVRVLATGAAIGLAAFVTPPVRARLGALVDRLAVGVALAAVALVAVDAPGWSGTLDRGAQWTGAVVAVAVVGVVAVGARTLAAMRRSTP